MGETVSTAVATRVAALASARTVSAPAISLRPLEAASRLSVRVRNPTDSRLDMPINRCVTLEGMTIARLGPDEWLVLGSEGHALEAHWSAALAGQVHSLVDISHRQVAIEVAGLRARDVLNGGCPLDLSDEAFAAGAATRTLLGKAEIVLIRGGTELSYRVECWRSFAPYVFGLLRAVAAEFAEEIS